MRIVLMFEVHQPVRLRLYEGRTRGLKEFVEKWFDWSLSQEVIERASKKCSIPANNILLEEVLRARDQGREFKVSMSLSGVLVDQLRRFMPEALESFRRLVKEGDVELLGQTYYHSLASLFSELKEFREQVKMHSRVMRKEFGFTPKVFENTEFIYNDEIAEEVKRMGFKAILTEGAERVLGWRSPTYLYSAPNGLKLLMRHYRLSDDVGFRFSNREWEHWPLTADKYAGWLSNLQGQFVLLAMDYETFGEHHWPESGIYEFLRHLPREAFRRGLDFAYPSEVAALEPADVVSIPREATLSWADIDKGIGAWAGNAMQRAALREVEELGRVAKGEKARHVWRLLQISDHFHYMFTGSGGPQEVHGYFSPFKDPLMAFITYMRALLSFIKAVKKPTSRT